MQNQATPTIQLLDFLHENVTIAFLVVCFLRLVTMATGRKVLLIYWILYFMFVIEV
jgi:hypothetical protein